MICFSRFAGKGRQEAFGNVPPLVWRGPVGDVLKQMGARISEGFDAAVLDGCPKDSEVPPNSGLRVDVNQADSPWPLRRYQDHQPRSLAPSQRYGGASAIPRRTRTVGPRISRAIGQSPGPVGMHFDPDAKELKMDSGTVGHSKRPGIWRHCGILRSKLDRRVPFGTVSHECHRDESDQSDGSKSQRPR